MFGSGYTLNPQYFCFPAKLTIMWENKDEEKRKMKRNAERKDFTEPVDLKSRWRLINTHEIGCSCVQLNCFFLC